MAMVNMNNLLNGKDSRWLQLEVCREFQRNKCSRPDTECKFAHPPANVEVQNGRVTACYDSIKGRCNREKPPCKYFHPPQHLKDQLLINGRNHLALKNALMQQMGLTPGQPLVPGQVQAVAANPYLTGMPQVGSTYSPYFAPGPIMPTIMGPDPTGVGSPLGVVPQTVVAQQKMPRSDRLEMDMKSVGSFYYDNFQAFPGMMPYKRPAADKSGVPVYQPNATTYQQLMQLQQPFVPVSCEYSASSSTPAPNTSCASPAAAAGASNPETVQSSVAAAAAHAAAAAAAHAAAVVSTSNLVTHHNYQQQQQQQQQQLQQQQQQISKENNEVSLPSTVITTTAPTANPAPAAVLPLPAMPDPAAIAKEVAQQSYAKAVKLAAVNQSLAVNSALHSQLNPLNYTGVALNKQALSAMPPPAFSRYSAATGLPLGAFGATAHGLNLNPYQAAAMAQQNLLNMAAASRPPHALINPYAAMLRTPYSATNTTPILGNNLLAGQYPVTVSAAPITNVTATNNIAAVAAQNNNNNNNVVLQPYKKLKTS